MPDPLLFELLHRVSSLDAKGQDRFSLAYEKAIKKKVEALVAEQITENKLLSHESLRQKIEEELRKNSDLSEFGENIALAVHIFRSEGSRYFDHQTEETLLQGINQLTENIDKLNLENLTDDLFYTAFEVLAPSTEPILKIAVSKFEEGLYRDSLAVFTFLTLVQPSEPDFWFRMGLVAQKENNCPLALRAFRIAEELHPQMIGPHIYAAMCLLREGLKEEAIQEVGEAKNYINQSDEEWADEIAAIESLLAQPESLKEK